MNNTHPTGRYGAASVPSCLASFSQSGIARWAPIPLRLIVGFGFMQHGFAKLEKGPEAFAAILGALSVPLPHMMAWLTILIEIFGGLAVFTGAFVALASVPMAAVLLVGVFTVHLRYGFSSIKLIAVTAAGAKFGPPGYECDLLYLACLAALAFGGSGPMSVDGVIRGYKERCTQGSDTSRHAAVASCSVIG
ncbi:MAG: DoxX family protein [Acidobacteriaceae bacterium]